MSTTEQTISALTIAAAVARYEQGDAGPIRDLLQQARGDAEMTRRLLREANVIGAPTFGEGGVPIYGPPDAIATLQRGLQRATEERDRALAALTPGGRRIYSDEEHRRRQQEAEENYRRARARVRETAQRAIDLLRMAEPKADDPEKLFDRLGADDLTRVAALRAFAEDDVLRLPAQELAARLEAVAEGGDMPTMLLYLRTIKRRLSERADLGQQLAVNERFVVQEAVRRLQETVEEATIDTGLRRLLGGQSEYWEQLGGSMVATDFLVSRYR